MKRLPLLPALLTLPSGCGVASQHQSGKPFGPLPNQADDHAAELVGKTFVNMPVWTVECALAVAFFAATVCARTGIDPTSIRL